MDAAILHDDYLDHSPTYRALLEAYGDRLTASQVEAICTLHSLTPADLDPWIWADDTRTASTLSLVIELGY